MCVLEEIKKRKEGLSIIISSYNRKLGGHIVGSLDG